MKAGRRTTSPKPQALFIPSGCMSFAMSIWYASRSLALHLGFTNYTIRWCFIGSHQTADEERYHRVSQRQPRHALHVPRLWLEAVASIHAFRY